MKLKVMTPRQVNKDQHWLKDEIEKERIEKEALETAEGRENEEKEKEVEKKMMEILLVNVFSSTVFYVILQEQKDKQVNETHQLPCLKRKLVHNALLCICSANEQQIRQTQRIKLFIVTYQGRWGSVGKRGAPQNATTGKEQI